jgi:hypothetical protein
MIEDVSFIKKINEIYSKLDAIVSANELYKDDSIAALKELKDLNISLIAEDFKKGNYLGNRKIDIDLNLNNASATSVPTYQSVTIVLVDGTKLEMPFDNGTGGILELSSHADIKNFIANHTLYSQVVDTELVVIESFNDIPAMIRFRDADGLSSNIERVELVVLTGTVIEQRVSYYWAKTTSALEVISNRTADIIKLNNNIDSLINLSQNTEELVEVKNNLAELLTIKNNLAGILASLQNSQTASTAAQVASNASQIATDKAQIATDKALLASNAAQTATDKLSKIQNIAVQAQTLAPGQNVQVSYDTNLNKFTFSIPSGLKGDRGDAFKVNSIGYIAQRSLYGAELTGFSFLAIDVVVDGSTIPHIYFKASNAVDDWTVGIPFGRGEKGNTGGIGIGIQSIVKTSGDSSSGSTDIYTITLTDETTHQFSVYNGLDSDITSADLLLKINILDIVNNLASTSIDKPLSAAQGKVLKDLIDNIMLLLSSDNTALDSIQEIVDLLELNRDTLALLGIPNITGLVDALAAKANIADVYTKVSLDLKISTQQFDKPSRGPLFVKVSPSSIKIPAGLKLTAATESFKVVSDYTLSLETDLLGSTKAAGTDYFVYAKADATFYISADDTITTDRLIGGFHYGLVGETEAPSGEKTEEMMVRQRGIWAASCWDLKKRPSSKSPRAKNFAFGIWADIYPADEDIAIRGYSSPWKDPYATTRAKAKLAGGTTEYGRGIPKIPLAFGGNGTLTYGKLNHWDACEIAASLDMSLLSFTEFSLLAKGVLENVSSLTNNYEITMGTIEHYPNLTSEYLEQATGVQWMWSSNLATNPTGTTWAWRTVTGDRGQIYSTENSPIAVILGGNRDGGVSAGSRASAWNNYVWNSNWYIGCRFACRDLELV